MPSIRQLSCAGSAKPAKFDRRETKFFRKRNLRCGAVIVAHQEHDSPATMYGRILVKDGSDQIVEALNQFSTSEGLRDDPGRRRLSSQFLGGHAVGIGHIDDRLSLPGRRRLRDILFSSTYNQPLVVTLD